MSALPRNSSSQAPSLATSWSAVPSFDAATQTMTVAVRALATRDLSPSDYWPQGQPPRPFLGHDERVDSEIAVRDPSAASASFELDVCLRNSSGALHCAADAAPPLTPAFGAGTP